jgi:iron(III) transport system substrate-binding protein
LRSPRPLRRPLVAGVVLLLSAALTACFGQSADLTIYSGRNPELVDGLLKQLEEEVGGTVEIRYAGSPELAAQLLEEGDATQADVFFSQDAGALGALDAAGRLQPLPPATLETVPAPYRADDAEVGERVDVRVVGAARFFPG